MAEHSAGADRPLQNRCEKPADGVGSVAVEDSVHAGVLADSGESWHRNQHSTSSLSEPRLECSSQSHEAKPQGEGQSAVGDVDLATLGGAAFAEFVPIQEAKRSILRLRPSELTRLLNSTPLGPVTSERQLYRHRERAGHRIGEQRWIDLVRYTAWLATERHETKRESRRRMTTKPANDRVTKQEVLELLDRQAFRCALTNWELTPHTASLDHVIPVSRGGKHNITNAQVLHEDVNRAKGTLTNDEFIALCRAVVAFADSNHQSSPLDKNTSTYAEVEGN